MKHVIIGIHGLSNKPPENDLRDGWLKAIKEGLAKNVGEDQPEFDFELFYWASHLYPAPDTEYEAYRPYPGDILPRGNPGIRSEIRDGVGQFLSDRLSRIPVVSRLRRWVRREKVHDLDAYYEPAGSVHPDFSGETFGPLVRRQFKEQVEKHSGDKVMVIAHSMGSIIAYDSLCDVSEEAGPVPDFVTIGAPLGFDLVRGKIAGDGRPIATPQIISERWGNYADTRDYVAFNWRLGNRYSSNESGTGVDSKIVRNTYKDAEGESNSHKSYGYLRTPELSQHIRNFLA